jgi:hypothetical protein
MTTPQPPANNPHGCADGQVEALAERLLHIAENMNDWDHPITAPEDLEKAAATLRSLLDENRRMREALQIQQDESDLQQQGYKLCDNPDHPLFVKWLGPSKPGESGYDRHFQMSALRRAMRIAALHAITKENK